MRSTEPTTAMTNRSPNSSPEPYSTTTGDLSCLTSPVRPAWFPCNPWPARPSATPHSARQPPEVDSKQKSDPTDYGGPANMLLTPTWPTVTNAGHGMAQGLIGPRCAIAARVLVALCPSPSQAHAETAGIQPAVTEAILNISIGIG